MTNATINVRKMTMGSGGERNHNLVSGDFNSIKIYIHSGVTATITDSFAGPGSDVRGVGFNPSGQDLISVEAATSPDKIFIHSGVTSTVTTSFNAPAGSTYSVVMRGKNLISCGVTANKIYIHNGVSSTITTSFTMADSKQPWGLSVRPNGNLVVGGADAIYEFVGQSSTVLQSFSSPATQCRGVAMDGEDLLSLCTGTTNTIYRHSGFTSTVASSFTTPSTNPSGIVMVP